MERGASAYGSGSWESCRTRRCQMKGGQNGIPVRHQHCRSHGCDSCGWISSGSTLPSRPHECRLLGLTGIGPDCQGQSRHLRLADPAPTLQVCFVNTLRPASGGVRGGADGCRVVPRRRGQGRGAGRVADGASCFFFGETRADWN